MKRKIIITLLILVLSILSLMFLMYFSDDREMKRISVDEMSSIINKKGNAIIYYGQEDCGACKVYYSMLRNAKESAQEEILYLDADTLSKGDAEMLSKYSVTETPMLIVISSGRVFYYKNISNVEQMQKALSDIDIVVERFNGIREIDYNDLQKKVEMGIDFFLYIGRNDCKDCIKFYPVLEEYVNDKSNYGMYYLDIKQYRDLTIVENPEQEHIDCYEDLKTKYEISWVPTVYHIRNGIIIAKYQFLSEEFYELTKSEQIKEEERFVTEFYDWMDIEMCEN